MRGMVCVEQDSINGLPNSEVTPTQLLCVKGTRKAYLLTHGFPT